MWFSISGYLLITVCIFSSASANDSRNSKVERVGRDPIDGAIKKFVKKMIKKEIKKLNIESLKEDVNTNMESINTNMEDIKANTEKLKDLHCFVEELAKKNNIFGGYEYKFVETTNNWASHQEEAVNWGGNLVSINSKAEQEFVVAKLIDLGRSDDVWLGGSRKDGQTYGNDAATWEWVDNSIFNFTKWAPNEPNNMGSKQDKIRMITSVNGKTGLWDDSITYIERQAIYKRPFPTNPNIFGSFEYKFVETTNNWASHQEEAVNWGGNLVSINSKAEQEFVVAKVIELGWSADDVWLGGSRKDGQAYGNDAATWEWVDNSIFDFTKWAPNEPNNMGIKQDKIRMITSVKGKTGLWDDSMNYTERQAIYKRSYP